MRIRFIFLALMIISASAIGQEKSFSFKQKEFKIIQFTDMHIKDAHNSDADSVYTILKTVIDIEKPDLVILTGDIAIGKKPKEVIIKLEKIFTERKLPWIFVFGNHDDEHKVTREELASICQKQAWCVNKTVSGIKGQSNFVIPVKNKRGKDAALIYCFDSHGYSNLKPKVEGYAWLDFSQINWYKKKHQEIARNSKKELPALAFFHIPLPEYSKAWENKNAKRHGEKGENVCSPDINSGMFTAMLEGGDVMGVFVGHDHINDYIAIWHDIVLAYGRCSGVEGAYGELTPGGRVIVLKENKRKFETWIRTVKGEKVQQVSYPSSF